MRVITNGPPKSGTNAIRALVVALGYSDYPGGIVNGVYYRPGQSTKTPIHGKPFGTVFNLPDGAVIGAHSPGLPTPAGYTQLRIRRDPREICVSWYRSRRAKPTPTGFRKWIHSVEAHQFFNRIERFAEWWNESGPEYFDYSTLFRPPSVRRLAALCGKPDADVQRIVQAAWGHSATWTGSPTIWTEWFDADARKRFNEKVALS